MMLQLDTMPPQFLVAIIGTISWAVVTIAIGVPLVRAWARRMERRGEPQMPADVSARLARIEAAVDSIAIEVERISENQRFLTKLQTERAALSAGGNPPDRQR
jgi:hypothetical protein